MHAAQTEQRKSDYFYPENTFSTAARKCNQAEESDIENCHDGTLVHRKKR